MQRKIHNKTLFVAALSVYLGLLIVGAPPQVWAQAAHPQSVVRQESEDENGSKNLESELNKLQALLKLEYAETLSDFLAELVKLTKAGSLDVNSFSNLYIQKIKAVRCKVDGDPAAQEIIEKTDFDGRVMPSIQNLLRTSQDKLFFLTDCLPNKRLKNVNTEEIKLKLNTNLQELNFEVTLNKKTTLDTQLFSEQLTKVFADKTALENDAVLTQIYLSTNVSFENNQVFIVTRLPRAALDSLLKADEKAN